MRLILTLVLAGLLSVECHATNVLLIGTAHNHPPGTHMYLEVCQVLQKCLEQTPGVVAVVSEDWPKDDSRLKNLDAIVLYTGPGGDVLLDPSHRAVADKLMKDGVGLTAIHWATDSKVELAVDYQALLGGWFSGPFGTHDITTKTLEQINPSHPICRGWSPFELYDEYYVYARVSPNARPLLKVELKTGPQTVAWTLERPKSKGGRSFGATVEHFYDTMKQEPFRRMLVNGVLWTAKVPIPATGAPVAISDQEIDALVK